MSRHFIHVLFVALTWTDLKISKALYPYFKLAEKHAQDIHVPRVVTGFLGRLFFVFNVFNVVGLIYYLFDYQLFLLLIANKLWSGSRELHKDLGFSHWDGCLLFSNDSFPYLITNGFWKFHNLMSFKEDIVRVGDCSLSMISLKCPILLAGDLPFLYKPTQSKTIILRMHISY